MGSPCIAACLDEIKDRCPDPLTLVDQRREDRAVYRMGQNQYLKAFAPAALAAFERECAGLEFARVAGLGAPAIVWTRQCRAGGGVLLTTAAPGRTLSELAGTLDSAGYSSALQCIGAWMGRCHTAAGPAQALLPTSHESERRSALRQAPAAIAALQGARVLTAEEAARLQRLIADGRSACFHSPVVFGHGDLNSDHLFLSGTPTRWICTAIDWESSGTLPQELDLVSPLLYVLGEALPGHRFAVVSRMEDHPCLQAFSAAYQRAANMPIPWRAVICHAVCWTLEVAQRCAQGASPPGKQGALTAARMALQFAQ